MTNDPQAAEVPTGEAIEARLYVLRHLTDLAEEHERAAAIARHEVERAGRVTHPVLREARLAMAVRTLTHHNRLAQYIRRTIASLPPVA
jgi:hypothetical protein